jgi:hypothetical protein
MTDGSRTRWVLVATDAGAQLVAPDGPTFDLAPSDAASLARAREALAHAPSVPGEPIALEVRSASLACALALGMSLPVGGVRLVERAGAVEVVEATEPPTRAEAAEPSAPHEPEPRAEPAEPVEASASEPAPWSDAPSDARVSSELDATPLAASWEHGSDDDPRAPTDDRPLETRLWELEVSVQRHGAASAEATRAHRIVLAHPSAAETTPAEAEASIERGNQSRVLLDELTQAALAHGSDSEIAREVFDRLVTSFPRLASAGRKQLEWAHAKRENRRGRGATRLRPGPSKRLGDLKSAPAWRIFIDETGQFEADEGPLGRVAAVVLRQGARLPSPPRDFHAATATHATLDEGMQCLLDAEGVGVFGLTRASVQGVPGHAWVQAVLETTHWVLRLLPIEANTFTEVEVVVEARAPHERAVEWDVPAQTMMRELVARAPGRFGGTRLSIRLVNKRRAPAELGYADLVSHVWSGRTPENKARVVESQLRGACLIDGRIDLVRRALDELELLGKTSPATWRALVVQPDAATPRSLVSEVLARIGVRCVEDVSAWDDYLRACLDHLDSKDVHLRALGLELEWLLRHRPAARDALPPTLEYAWRTAQFESANHLGATTEADEQRLEELAVRLLDEAPRLVCQADLDRAVRATNRFAFDEASRKLARWSNAPPAVPGLQAWARVQSSFGQHAAFRGEFDEAELFFAEALAAFAKLSDAALGRRESRQTATYRAIAAMDAPHADPAVVRERVAAVVPVELPALRRLGASVADADKYAHHLAVRWLVAHGTEAERRAYAADPSAWKTGFGHPWPLIDAYRALVLEQLAKSPSAMRTHWGRAVEDATSNAQGPAVRFIGLVLALAARSAGVDPSLDLAAVAADLRRTLPLAPWSTWDELRERPVGSLETMRRLLPFHFR